MQYHYSKTKTAFPFFFNHRLKIILRKYLLNFVELLATVYADLNNLYEVNLSNLIKRMKVVYVVYESRINLAFFRVLIFFCLNTLAH